MTDITATITEPFPVLTKHHIRVLLIDDQVIIAEAIRRMLEPDKDISFYYCQDPSKAIQMASEIKPTVILQDLVMPTMDGLTLVKYLRANPATRDIPLIVLSIKEDPAVKAQAFELGANDYLVKIPDKMELIARIRYHSTAYILLLQRNEAYQKLLQSQSHLSAELNEAAEYVRSQLPEPLQNGVEASWQFIPSAQLGGDAFGYYWLDEDHFVMYLLDVCGHGVGAALLSVTIMTVLNTQMMANTNFADPAQVLMALNNAFLMEKHNNMFFTIWYGVYNKKDREIVYSNGGHPPPVLMTGEDDNTMSKELMKGEGLVVGAMPNTQYTNEKSKVGKQNRLFIFSDGVYELTRKDHTYYNYDLFNQFISNLPKDSKHQLLDIITNNSRAICGNEPFPDDFSILLFKFK